MKKISFVALTFMILCLFSSSVYAECSNDELITIKNEIKKIKISYKHLGEIIKDDGSKVYDEFLVTARNMPDDVYIHLYPSTMEKFEKTDDGLVIKLTTGEWKYNMYSSQCQRIIDTITFKLPTFNIYSLDPLCKDIDGNEFKLCSKYYEGTVSREDFERRVNNYRQLHVKEKQDDENVDNSNILSIIIDFIKSYYIYVISALIIILLFIVFSRALLKKKNKKVLQ